MSGGDGVVWWKGSRFDARTVQQLEEAERLSGMDLQPTQGSYNSSVGASAGTHAGCGAWDGALRGSQPDMERAVEALRRVGMAAWVRTAAQGFVPHVHAISVQPGGKNDRGCLSASAHAQVIDYYNGRDGLRGRAPDDGPRQWVGVTWETYQQDKQPEPEPEREDEDVLLIEAPNRGVQLVGVGGYHQLTPEERDCLLVAGVRLVKVNERQYDVIRQAAIGGVSSTLYRMDQQTAAAVASEDG